MHTHTHTHTSMYIQAKIDSLRLLNDENRWYLSNLNLSLCEWHKCLPHVMVTTNRYSFSFTDRSIAKEA